MNIEAVVMVHHNSSDKQKYGGNAKLYIPLAVPFVVLLLPGSLRNWQVIHVRLLLKGNLGV